MFPVAQPASAPLTSAILGPSVIGGDSPSASAEPVGAAQSAVTVSWTLNAPDMVPVTVLEFPMPSD
jgi:hypothetical protein